MALDSYSIWWSPMGGSNGSDKVLAGSKNAAEQMTYDRMRQISGCGACGADKIDTRKEDS